MAALLVFAMSYFYSEHAVVYLYSSYYFLWLLFVIIIGCFFILCMLAYYCSDGGIVSVTIIRGGHVLLSGHCAVYAMCYLLHDISCCLLLFVHAYLHPPYHVQGGRDLPSPVAQPHSQTV